MTTLVNGSGHKVPYSVDNSVSLLGEIIAWEWPRNLTVAHSDLVQALQGAGLDGSLARDLAPRHAFVRAVRSMAERKLIDKLVENRKEITFQFSEKQHQADRIDYQFETTVTLLKATGTVTCPDATVQARAVAELDKALKERKTRDVTRLLHTLFEKHADLFTVKAGVYFVPDMHSALLDQVEQFIIALGGSMQRFPVPEGTVQGNSTVQQIVTDGLMETLNGYEEAIHGLSMDSRIDVVARAQARLVDVADKIAGYDRLLGTHKARLEDHLAWLEALLRKQTSPEPQPQEEVEGGEPTIEAEPESEPEAMAEEEDFASTLPPAPDVEVIIGPAPPLPPTDNNQLLAG